MGKLTALAVKAALANPGTYQDGDGLFLKVDKRGGASWTLRLQRDGKRQDIGLGSAKLLSLAEVRDKASGYRKAVKIDRRDVLAEKKDEAAAKVTFSTAARQYHSQNEEGWKSAVYARQGAEMDWNAAQVSADELLAEGLFALTSAQKSNVHSAGPGNYLFSHSGRPMYVGEAKDCRKRLAQQMDERRSTFYKNYCELGLEPIEPISSFAIQHISVAFGRKEIEDFGIVNLPAQLNRFQLGKRAIQPRTDSAERWMRLQELSADLLTQGADRCEEVYFRPWPLATAPASSGLYLIRSQQAEIIYVGESSDINARFRTHGTRTYFSAVRRNLGVDVLGFELQAIKGKKRYFSDGEGGRWSGHQLFKPVLNRIFSRPDWSL